MSDVLALELGVVCDSPQTHATSWNNFDEKVLTLNENVFYTIITVANKSSKKLVSKSKFGLALLSVVVIAMAFVVTKMGNLGQFAVGAQTQVVEGPYIISPGALAAVSCGGNRDLTIDRVNSYQVTARCSTVIQPTPTPVSGSATPTPVSVPSLPAGSVVVDFNNFTADQSLTGSNPFFVDWGNGQWFVTSAWGGFASNSLGFNSSSTTTASFAFRYSEYYLTRLSMTNGGDTVSTVTVRCGSQAPLIRTLQPGQTLVSVPTGFVNSAPVRCAQVTISSTNGWDTSFDDLVFRDR